MTAETTFAGTLPAIRSSVEGSTRVTVSPVNVEPSTEAREGLPGSRPGS